MRGSKALALPLLLVMMLGAMGLSYAWWTETLVIDDNVNTGELKVVFTDMFGRKPEPLYNEQGVGEVYTAYNKWWPSEGGNPQYLPLTDDTLTMKFRNMFPGCVYHVYWLELENQGTIPAKLKSITITINDPGGIKSYVQWMSSWSTLCKIIRADGTVVPISNPYPGQWKPIEEVPDWYYNALKDYVLYPGDQIKFDGEDPDMQCFTIRLSPDAPNSAEDYTITFDIEFTWTQFNGT